MELYANPTITDFRQDVNGDIKMLKIGVNKEDAYANIIGQAEGAALDNNKTKTINVSTYTEPVEVLPTAGKDGMKKATITLSNIPAGGGTLYAWKRSSSGTDYFIYTVTTTPTTTSGYLIGDRGSDNGSIIWGTSPIAAVGENTITIGEDVYTRDTDDDITLQD